MKRRGSLVAVAVLCSTVYAVVGMTPAWGAVPDAVVHTGGTPLRVRSGPAVAFDRIGSLASGTRIQVACRIRGQRIHGLVSTTDEWDLLTAGGYVSGAYLAARRLPPFCRSTLPTDPAAFIAAAVPLARTWASRYGVPASVTIAQAILESGWGRSRLSRDGNGVFGMKCFGGAPGPVAAGCRTYPTRECSRSGCHDTQAAFRFYHAPADAFRDHAQLLGTAGRYLPALRYRQAADQYAQAIQRAGYATDPRYAAKLIALMHSYDLHRYDN